MGPRGVNSSGLDTLLYVSGVKADAADEIHLPSEDKESSAIELEIKSGSPDGDVQSADLQPEVSPQSIVRTSRRGRTMRTPPCLMDHKL